MHSRDVFLNVHENPKIPLNFWVAKVGIGFLGQKTRVLKKNTHYKLKCTRPRRGIDLRNGTTP